MEPRMGAQAVIVVVQDNPFVREMLCDWLRRGGHVVQGAANERAALRLLEEQSADLAIVELNGYRIDGLSLVRAVQSKLGDASLILTTSAVEHEQMAAALSPSIPVVVMGKPYSFYTLEQVVKAALMHARTGDATRETRKCSCGAA